MICDEDPLVMVLVVMIMGVNCFTFQIEHLKVCSEIATSRPYNWQAYCRQHQGKKLLRLA